jgi:sugar phosphate isomerase/epimerase
MTPMSREKIVQKQKYLKQEAGKETEKERKNRLYGIAIGNLISPRTPYPLGGNLAESIKKASEYGYKAIELHNIKNPNEVNVDKLLNYCRNYDVKISAISTGPSNYIDKLSLIDDSERRRKTAILRLKEYIELAIILQAFVIIGTFRGNVPDNGVDASVYNGYEEELYESIAKALDCTESKDVTILIEGANRYEINYLNTASEIIDFINKYNIPNLKIHLDTFHMNIEEADIAESIKKCGNLLGYFHAADSNRMYPGAGHINFKPIARALKKVHYRGYIIVECLPSPDGDTAAKKALEYIKEIF